MLRVVLIALGLGAAVVAGAVAFAWTGLFSVAASSGHTRPVAWFLHFTMQSSVRTHALGITPPGDLRAARHVRRGAGHFELGCAPCHGSPIALPSVVVQQMVPPPPNLDGEIEKWRPRELFWIVKHGIKYTGMPAWPALPRDDEVWAMTAFLLELPRLAPLAYRRLVTPPGVEAESDGQRPAAGLGDLARSAENAPIGTCAMCHGFDGLGTSNGAFPRIAGQPQSYLEASLRSFAAGTRHSGIMQPVAERLTEAQIERLAAHFSGLPWRDNGAEAMVEGDAVLGRQIALEGLPRQGVPACASCHDDVAARAGEQGNQRSAAADGRGAFPRIAGQHANYLLTQLQLFADSERGGRRAQLMQETAARLSEAQRRAVASYLAAGEPVAQARASASEQRAPVGQQPNRR